MADTTVYDDTNKEPATAHDVTEGGVLGAVGGAIVGALAGGPVGAIIGAVVGGVASAGAVDVVDKHDHDYARTAGYDDGTDTELDSDDAVVTDDLRGNRVVDNTIPPVNTYGTGTTGYADTAATTPAYTDTYATSTPAAAVSTGTTYNDATAIRDNGTEVVLPVVEEELQVGKRVEQSGGARIHTEVIETPVSESVTLREEHVTVDRRPVDRAATSADFTTGARDIELTETREVPVVAKEARVVEEVVVGKTASEHTETVSDTVRRTDVVVDDVASTTTSGTTRTGSY